MDPPDFVCIQALEGSRLRLAVRQRDTARVTELDKQRLEVRSHVLTLREGELDSRLRNRDRTIEDLICASRTQRPAPQGTSHARIVIAADRRAAICPRPEAKNCPTYLFAVEIAAKKARGGQATCPKAKED
jgi:hypothetical protein